MPKNGFTQIVIKGTAKNDILEGGAGANRLIGGAGDDRIIASWDDLSGTPSNILVYDGGTGNDTLDFSKFDRPIGIDLYFGPYLYLNYDRDLYGSQIHYNPNTGDRLAGAVSGIENIIGSEFADYLQGSSGNNLIQGRGGNDYIASQRGTDVVIGGSGDDYIFLGSHNSTVTGDDLIDPSIAGNDTFVAAGNDAGIFSSIRITDFDLRESADDLQYDQLHFSSYQQVTWGQNAAGELVATRWAYGGAIGEVIFSNLTLADAPYVPVFTIDPATDNWQPVPYSPSYFFP